jgi:hypothetical protein
LKHRVYDSIPEKKDSIPEKKESNPEKKESNPVRKESTHDRPIHLTKDPSAFSSDCIERREIP